MAELILRSGKRAGKRIPLPGAEAVIGRDEGCHIRLTSSDISRRHCLLRVSAGQIVAADLGSRNGTHVNDSPIKAPTPLRPGDLLRIGPFLFQVPRADGGDSADAEISGWLTEEGTLAGGPPANVANDTAFVPDLGAAEKGTAEMEVLPTAESRPEPDAGRLPPDPIVAQAAEVIGQYWAAKKPKR